jgi:two-component system NtrC family sensor kinase
LNNFLRKYLHSLKFKTKITLGVTLMLVTCGLSIGLILSAMSAKALLDEGKKRGAALTSGLAFRLAEPLLAMDFLQMKNLIDYVEGQYDDVIYIFLLDTNNNVPAHTFSGGFPVDLLKISHDKEPSSPVLLDTERGLIYDFIAQIKLGEKILGAVRLGLSRSDLDAQIRRQQSISLLITLGIVSLGVVLALWFARTITYRLNRLRESAEEIVKGNLNVQAGFTLEKNCWEIMECGKTECPAYGDNRRRCWYLAGTLCPNCGDAEYPLKKENCRLCPVFKTNFGDELQDLAEAFDVMAVTVKNHIEEITEREKTIGKQQRLLKTIMDVTPDFIALQDKDLTYTFAGKAFCEFLGLREEEVIGKNDFDILTQEQAAHNAEEDSQILRTGHPHIKEITFKRADGQRWFHVVKVPVYDQDNSIIGLLLTARDISLLKKFQEQLIQAQKMEGLGRLAGGVAHEINTPLGIILGYSQLMMDDIHDEELLENLKTIEKQAKICRKIVADLLGFSRHTKSVRDMININTSMQEVIALVEHALFMNHIQVIQAFAKNLPLLHGDKEQLQQVWLNLLNNAADAIGQEGIIFVRSQPNPLGNTIEVSVADTGQGIKEEHLSKIFDPFFTTKQVDKGTGLGLSVSFGIIKDHGGHISAVSPTPEKYLPRNFTRAANHGPGAVFVVELPVSAANNTAARTDSAHEE